MHSYDLLNKTATTRPYGLSFRFYTDAIAETLSKIERVTTLDQTFPRFLGRD